MEKVMTSFSGAVAILILATASSAYAQAPSGRVIEVRNSDGSVYGSLRLNASGEVLLLSWQGQEHPIGECMDDVLQEVRGDGATAVIYVRNCGATVDFATHVAIRGGGGSEVVAVFVGWAMVRVEWNGRDLQVVHSTLGPDGVFKRLEVASDGRKIMYDAKGPVVPPTQYVDYASFNYGATGRAAGLPTEMLQRVAGWSQEASGLYRSEWGTWSGSHPYGDGPRGRDMVQNGIQYFECQYCPEKAMSGPK
jgi:hypothetical protein